MNVFVLNTGRCGSVSLNAACNYITNFTSAHESRSSLSIDYPKNHIEIDNRLSWFLGRLEKKYGDNAKYIHLKRNPDKVANSMLNRYNKGIMRGYHKRILLFKPGVTKLEICKDYVHTVNSNIEAFLKNKTYVMEINVENFSEDFKKFWNFIDAQGNLENALKELSKKHNVSKKLKFDYIKNNFFTKIRN